MSKCFNCGADTQLFENGVPICMKCAEKVDAKREENEKKSRESCNLGVAFRNLRLAGASDRFKLI